ncbi:MAG: ATP-binding cassette domain-containing protein, partial [Lachnospiraceae bacterium]|nr:ATP-binding cassette domain-containing protein [Lachnospiraceae bacterium]
MYLLIWLCLWQIIAILVHNPIYFAAPADVLVALTEKMGDRSFWMSVTGSLLRILGGFFGAFFLAFLCAFAAHNRNWVKDFLSPFIMFLKSVPIAAVVVILLIWWGPKYLVLCISLMVVFPNIYLNMQAGLQHARTDLLEVAKVFGFRKIDTFLWIYRSAYLPHLHSAMSVSLGMCFKSGIAAEIIGLPEFSIGEQLYRDKIYFHTAGVFAWIIVVLCLSTITEKLILFLFHRFALFPKSCPMETGASLQNTKISSENDLKDHDGLTVFSNGPVTKTFNDRLLINTELKLEKGKIYYLPGPSGAGKTTLLHLIAGLTDPENGSIESGRISMVFQEDRLVESANALRNLRIAGCRGNITKELKELLPKEVLSHPVSELSGGERRRVCIARALLHPSDLVIADEPFTGMDEETKKKCTAFILSHLEGRTFV